MNAPPRHDKFRAYRQRKRAAGLREVRMWMPDLTNAAVIAAIAEENIRLGGHTSEAADFIDAAMADSMRGRD